MTDSVSKNNHILRVVKAKITRDGKRIDFTEKVDLYVEINQKTANVSYINSEVQNNVGPQYVVVGSDGNIIADCESTQSKKINFVKDFVKVWCSLLIF